MVLENLRNRKSRQGFRLMSSKFTRWKSLVRILIPVSLPARRTDGSEPYVPSLHYPQILSEWPLFINPLRFTNETGAHCHLTHGSHTTQIYAGRRARD